MHLHSGPFAKIKSGEKNIEVRMRDEKRKKIKIGDDILFISRENGETALRRVVGLCWFEDFAQLAKTLGAVKCGWDKEYAADKYNSDMEQYYSKDDIKKHGALGIILNNMR
jgi:ASC-1-like (ASCH) protein